MATEYLEKRVSDPEEMVGDIPRILNMRFALVRAQLDTLDARISTLEVKIDSMRAELHAMPRVLAEMLDECDKRKR